MLTIMCYLWNCRSVVSVILSSMWNKIARKNTIKMKCMLRNCITRSGAAMRHSNASPLSRIPKLGWWYNWDMRSGISGDTFNARWLTGLVKGVRKCVPQSTFWPHQFIKIHTYIFRIFDEEGILFLRNLHNNKNTIINLPLVIHKNSHKVLQIFKNRHIISQNLLIHRDNTCFTRDI